MGDWNISRKRYFGLPLPLYPCSCGHLNVIGSRAELEERATAGLEGLQELHRPWIDAVTIRCEECGGDVERIPEVGDAWLDAGIVPFSTLGWKNSAWIEHGNATGAAAGLTGADLPDHAYWEKWFPADWVSESREQIRLWFYSQSFMAETLDGRSPYRAVLAYERMLDETGLEMHKSTGNAIDANEALERMGADVMRWIFCVHVPSQNILFGYGPADETKRRLLTFWNSVAFFITYANVDGFDPVSPDRRQAPRPLARVAHRRVRARRDRRVRPLLDASRRRGVRGLRRRSVELVHPALAAPLLGRRRDCSRSLWDALAAALQVIAPVMPFLAEHLWRNLVGEDESVFLAGWPEAGEPTRRCWPRWLRCGASSSSGGRRALLRG
jgi:isoleucyl-tRNA synthetase